MRKNMDTAVPPFPNDGSFLERFKQMQGMSSSSSTSGEPATTSSSTGAQPVNITLRKSSLAPAAASKLPAAPATPAVASNGKLAFSLKPKAKLPINPLKLEGNDEEEEEGDAAKVELDRQSKKQRLEAPEKSSQHAPAPPPTDPDVQRVADKLASFVAKTGRQFEDITRQKNPTDPRFGFLFNVNSPEYKYYERKLADEEAALSKSQEVPPNTHSAYPLRPHSGTQTPNYQTPASALYDDGAQHHHSQEEIDKAASDQADSLAMMEFYMKKAAQEDLRKPAKQTPDEMPASVALPSTTAAQKRGHHMGDYIPQEELDRFMAKCNDSSTQKVMLEAAEKAKIQADNIGHRLLSKMGWKEGEGLGSTRDGRADPVQAGSVKLNNLGVGAQQPGEVSAEDDIYEQYKKRMMLGYKHRPNPLNNPRKAYY